MTDRERSVAKATGLILKNYRKSLKWRHKDIAEALRVSESIWAKWENGLVNVPDWVPEAVRRMMYSVELDELSPEELGKLKRRAQESGKTTEKYITDLIRAAIGTKKLDGDRNFSVLNPLFSSADAT